MNNLHDYLDGLLDSGAESFPREVLEKIKAMADKPQVVKEYVYYPYWQWQPWQWQTITTNASKQWITVGGTGGAIKVGQSFWFNSPATNATAVSSGTIYLTPNQFNDIPHTLTNAQHDS